MVFVKTHDISELTTEINWKTGCFRWMDRRYSEN